jgi:ATP synthase protein I
MSENNGDPRDSFEDRLRAARSRRGLDTPAGNDPGDPKTASEEAASPLGVGMRVGVELVSALAVAVAMGWGLDRWLHTLPLFLVIFVVLGGVAGLMNVWRLVGPAARK